MSITTTYASHADARKAGWFSRRHETNAAHVREQERRRQELDAKAEREQMQRDHTAASKQEVTK